MKDAFPYEDILHLPHHTSLKHPHMSPEDRAAQFSPFAALSGYEAAVEETSRLTHERAELSEEKKSELDRKLRRMLEMGEAAPEAVVEYFVPDDWKPGGEYSLAAGHVLRRSGDFIVMDSGRWIPIEEIREITCPELDEVF